MYDNSTGYSNLIVQLQYSVQYIVYTDKMCTVYSFGQDHMSAKEGCIT